MILYIKVYKVTWKVIKLITAEPNFKRWVIDQNGTLASEDFLWNRVWYCKKKDIFPIREVRDKSWKNVVWILCWDFHKCRVCPNVVPTIYDETEFILDEIEQVKSAEWMKEAHRQVWVKQYDIQSRLESELERLEIEKLVRLALLEQGYQREA